MNRRECLGWMMNGYILADRRGSLISQEVTSKSLRSYSEANHNALILSATVSSREVYPDLPILFNNSAPL